MIIKVRNIVQSFISRKYFSIDIPISLKLIVHKTSYNIIYM